MSSPRVQKIYEVIPNALRKTMGQNHDIRETVRWQGRVVGGSWDGADACVIDLTDATWAGDNQHAVIVSEPASDLNGTEGLKTQSHSKGSFIDGSVRFHIYVETPAAWTGSHAEFVRALQHNLLGANSAPIKFHWTANDTQPTVEGVQGEGATAANTEGEWQKPYGMSYAGGV